MLKTTTALLLGLLLLMLPSGVHYHKTVERCIGHGVKCIDVTICDSSVVRDSGEHVPMPDHMELLEPERPQ